MAPPTRPTTAAGPRLSVIVPVGPEDRAWPEVLPHLAGLDDAEVVFVGAEAEPASFSDACRRAGFTTTPAWIRAKTGRARQQNAGAAAARGDILWFLHADCRPSDACVRAISGLRGRPGRWLAWFQLRFLRDGPALTRLNAWGANLRSRLWRLPFGDQGLCMPASVFQRLGGFDETLPVGEDLDLVVRARATGIGMVELPCKLDTSARKYRGQWLFTTRRHVGLTVRLTHEARRRAAGAVS